MAHIPKQPIDPALQAEENAQDIAGLKQRVGQIYTLVIYVNSTTEFKFKCTYGSIGSGGLRQAVKIFGAANSECIDGELVVDDGGGMRLDWRRKSKRCDERVWSCYSNAYTKCI